MHLQFQVIFHLTKNKVQMQAETLVIEKNSPATGIIELIDQNHITKLVMGTSSVSVYVQMQYSSFITGFIDKYKSQLFPTALFLTK
jgi:K+-sensing histidine kinase KdpD